MTDTLQALGEVKGARLLGYTFCAAVLILCVGAAVYMALRGAFEKD